MRKYLILLLSISFFQLIQAQVDTFTGTIPTTAQNSYIEKVTTHGDIYYFGAFNIEEDAESVSIFQTTQNFEVLNSIKNLKIRGINTSYITYLEVVDERLIILSSANVDGTDYLYSHSLSLDLGNQILIDSIELSIGTNFIANEYKRLESNGNIYAIGNIFGGIGVGVLSANYLEFTVDGKFERFEELTFRDIYNVGSISTITFDYNPNTKQFFVAEPFISYLFDSTFTEIAVFPAIVPIQTPGSFSILALSGSCNFTSDNRIECISSGRVAAQYTNFLVEYGVEQDSLFYVDAVPLHPNADEETRAVLVHVSRDTDENYYFSYHSPFFPRDGAASPNKVFISKFDKDLNEIYFLEFENNNEHIISESVLDDENNLIIVGAIETPDSPLNAKNFYIKVSENGEVLTNTFSPPIINGIDIYPNPCDDILYVDSVDPNVDASYSIYALDGRLILDGVFTNTSKKSISTLALPSGMYVLHIFDGQAISVDKFVKQ